MTTPTHQDRCSCSPIRGEPHESPCGHPNCYRLTAAQKHEDRLAAVTAAIVKAVPEILDIRHRGCTFDDADRGDRWTTCCGKCDGNCLFAFSCIGDWHDLPYVEQDQKWHYKYRKFGPEELEGVTSLGRHITLEDVLRCPDPPSLKGLTEEEYALRLYRFLKQQWTLGLPLHQQSPETIAFLHFLLCPKPQ